MKIINKLIVPVCCLVVILIVFLKMDLIVDFLMPFIEQDAQNINLPLSPYKKNTDYLFVQNVDNYLALSKHDIQNIFFSIVNNGWKSFNFYCAKEYNDCLKDIEEISQNQELLTHINNFVHPYHGFSNLETIINESGLITVNVTYFYNEDHILAINDRINEIYNEIINDSMDTRTKIKTIHDYIISHTKYDASNQDNNLTNYQSYLAYGVLFEGYATCNGYTDTMALFLEKMQIPNFKIATTPPTKDVEGHVWNAVYLDNQWYHLDLTWDDPVSSDDKDYLLDTYCLKTTSEINEIDNKGDKPIHDHDFKKNIYLEFNEKTSY